MKIFNYLLILLILVFAACSQSEEGNERDEETHIDLLSEMDTTVTSETSELPPDSQSDTIAGFPAGETPEIIPLSAPKTPEKTPEKPAVKLEVTKAETPVVKPEAIEKREPVKEEPVIKADTEVSLSITNTGNNISVSGTSTMHDWTMATTSMTGNANILINDAGQLVSIDAISFSLPVANLQSKDKKMDNNARDALKANQYPTINFQLTNATFTPIGNNRFSIKANGNLTIAGVTRGMSMDVTGVLNNNRSLSITGKKSFNMTDFDIKPPQFLLGTMKTGDKVTVDFNILLMP